MSGACPTEELLERFCRGELPPEEADPVREHVGTCADCRQRTLHNEETLELLDDLRVVVDRGEADPALDLFGQRYARGVRFGPYEIQDLLGAGGMSKVFRALHTESNEVVALKVLKGEHEGSPEIQARFAREAHAMVRIHHPNIVRVYDCPAEQGRTGIAMELMTGGSLADWIARRRREGAKPDAERVLAMSLEAARGLGAAQAQGLVHRDIKPSNLLLDGRGSIKISDFGVVQALESTTWVTGTGHQIGTPAYMSPEQCKGERASPASDVYSLGVTMFELVTGQLPYATEGGSPFAQMLKHISDPVADPRTVNPEVPERFALVIVQCLQKAPGDRYRDGDALSAALDRAMRPAPEEQPPPPAGVPAAVHGVNTPLVRQQLERLPQRSIVAWACRCARRVQGFNDDPRVERAIAIAESVAGGTDEAQEHTPSSRILARMQRLRTASLAAAYADKDVGDAAVAAARAAAAASASASSRCAADAAADAVFALESALRACREGGRSPRTFWQQAQKDYRRLHQARLGPPGTIGQPVPPEVWSMDV
ncbi:MAG: protein kinase [bacterium]|nr:protein kinase [bacterium]